MHGEPERDDRAETVGLEAALDDDAPAVRGHDVVHQPEREARRLTGGRRADEQRALEIARDAGAVVLDRDRGHGGARVQAHANGASLAGARQREHVTERVADDRGHGPPELLGVGVDGLRHVGGDVELEGDASYLGLAAKRRERFADERLEPYLGRMKKDRVDGEQRIRRSDGRRRRHAQAPERAAGARGRRRP